MSPPSERPLLYADSSHESSAAIRSLGIVDLDAMPTSDSSPSPRVKRLSLPPADLGEAASEQVAREIEPARHPRLGMHLHSRGDSGSFGRLNDGCSVSKGGQNRRAQAGQGEQNPFAPRGRIDKRPVMSLLASIDCPLSCNCHMEDGLGGAFVFPTTKSSTGADARALTSS